MGTPFQPPTGLVSDDTVFSAPGRWKDADGARFYDGNWQAQAGFESLTTTLLTGVCRAVFGWTDITNVQNFAFGTHSNLQVWRDGALTDITPVLDTPVTLGANPIATTNLSATIVVTDTAHGLAIGDPVTLSGASVVATVTINGSWTVSAVSANTWSFVAGSAANATATGGGAVVVRTASRGFTAGAIDGTGGAGIGTGAYGVGTYGSPSTADYFPLTWSLASYETGDLYACPRDQTIYRWQQDIAKRAAPLANAPAHVTVMLSTDSRQIMALGCSPEANTTGPADPLTIRFSDIENPTDWTTTSSNNAGEVVLSGGGRIVGGVVVGKYVVAFTDSAAYLGTFVGSPDQTWSFELVGKNCGLIGPQAPVVKGLTVAWPSPDAQFWSYTLGGEPQVMACPIRKEFADNISLGQKDKIVGATVSGFQEIKWFYPDARDGLENSRDIVLNPEGWCHGQLARTAFVDAGPADSPVGCTADGHAYVHEKGNSADGGILAGFIESTDFYIDEAQQALKINGMWPNFKDQVGPLTVTFYVREFPQATERTKGPFTLTPGMSKKSLNFSGAIVRVRFAWSSAPAYVRGGKQEFDAQPIGKR